MKQTLTGEGWVAFCEPASDSQDPVRDGDIYAAVILPGAQILPDTLSHALAVKSVKPGEPLIYYAGSGWSQGGVDDMKEWLNEVNEEVAAATSPLRVTVR